MPFSGRVRPVLMAHFPLDIDHFISTKRFLNNIKHGCRWVCNYTGPIAAADAGLSTFIGYITLVIILQND